MKKHLSICTNMAILRFPKKSPPNYWQELEGIVVATANVGFIYSDVLNQHQFTEVSLPKKYSLLEWPLDNAHNRIDSIWRIGGYEVPLDTDMIFAPWYFIWNDRNSGKLYLPGMYDGLAKVCTALYDATDLRARSQSDDEKVIFYLHNPIDLF